MNRILAGTVALAAAAVLCLGGAGSMAFWEMSEQGAGATFQTGGMTIDPVPGTAHWSSGGADLQTTDRVVPGSVLTYTQEFSLVMDGTDLAATITLSPGGISSGTTGLALTDATLIGPVVPTGDLAWDATGTGTVELTLTYEWSVEDAANGAQGATISIDPSSILMTQVAL